MESITSYENLTGSKGLNTLLVADTHIPIHKLFKRCFTSQFHEILTACNEEDAEKLIRTGNVSHIVISSQIAETTSTRELVARWRSQFPSIQRVILHTGAGIGSLQSTTPFDAVLAKPSPKQTIEQTVMGN